MKAIYMLKILLLRLIKSDLKLIVKWLTVGPTSSEINLA